MNSRIIKPRGRQKGDGGRSKARPSGSSRAASLLPSGTTAVGFGGYIGSSRVDSSSSSPETTVLLFFSFSELVSDMSIDIDGELAQHLKRLARTTKLKALTSLSVLLKERPRKDILPIVPQWYSTGVAFEITFQKFLLACCKRFLLHGKKLDVAHGVLDISHECQTNVMFSIVGQSLHCPPIIRRDLALHLKSLMGPWWFSKFDPVSEVSQPAKRSFQAAFSAQEKRLGALILSTNERFLYLEENLALTPQSMSDKAVAQDEIEEMHQQVISLTLLALASLLDFLVSMPKERPDVENVTTESKHASKARLTAISFTKMMFLTQSQSPAIRSATYSFLSSFIKNIPRAVNDGNLKTLSATIIESMGWKEPTLALDSDRAAFFQDFEECFLWVVHNASSSNVLVKLLWNEYLLTGSKNKENVSPGMPRDQPDDITKHPSEKNFRSLDIRHPETFIPWCLWENVSSISARVDLLLALLENECFSEQWSSIIAFATGRPTSIGSSTSLDSGNAAVLAMLVEKVRVGIGKQFLRELDRGTIMCKWHHEILDSAAVSVSCIFPPFDTSHVRFLGSGERLAPLRTESMSNTINTSGNDKFVAFIDKLISKIGFERVIVGSVSHCLWSAKEETVPVTAPTFHSRAWLAAEILCSWKWHGGKASCSFLPKVVTHVKSAEYSHVDCLLDSIINIQLDGALIHAISDKLRHFNVWPVSDDEVESGENPYLRALLYLLLAFIDDGPDYIEKGQMDDTLKDWLERTLSFPPIKTWQMGEEWFQLVVSSYPLSRTGGKDALNLLREISPMEKSLLFGLFRKQRHAPGAVQQQPELQMLLSKLTAVSVGYCWKEFDEEDWEFIVSHLRRWIGSAVLVIEEVAETVNDTISSASSCDDLDQTLKKLKHAISVLDPSTVNTARNALFTFSLFCGLLNIQPADNIESLNLKRERWDAIKDHDIEDILRLFFSSGVTEAIAASSCKEACYIVASTRLKQLHFSELVASSVVQSSVYARDKAVKSVQYWALSKGPYMPSFFLPDRYHHCTEPVSHLAIVEEDTASLNGDTASDQDSGSPDFSSEENIHGRPELTSMIKKLPLDILEMDLVAQEQVNVFLAWSLLLSYLLSLSSSSSAWAKLVQWIQNSTSSRLLDCIFWHIPLETGMAHNFKKKGVKLPAGVSEAACAAIHAIIRGSLCSFVKSLWPLNPEHMASLAGAIFGVMLRILPAYVRGWFSDLHDRSTSFVIECFTKTWSSPPLLKMNYFSVSKSAYEVVATYTKDEKGMDLVIHLPSSYPLRPVDVDCARCLGISEVKQGKWLLSMMSFVRNQNGALAEAIRIWKSNFDKEFEGVEECPICYCVIHIVDHSRPRLACKTCKHKFHAACMYKWLSTSHK
ncbi:hypothetical protein RJ641_008887 [Dillenia turbinata]|uniref:E3 ubiquitin-protein ligase listerin n=1 Tax=Dillenia turbinata TaxID=194707 RepID=A0AAN8ZB61_9MAGN